MGLPTKQRRAAFKQAAKKISETSVDDSGHKETTGSSGTGIKLEQEDTPAVSSDQNNVQSPEANSVPLYAKNAAYALKIPCGINFLNIEDTAKWESDVHLEESDTDPLSTCEDIIKKEPLVKEEVMPASYSNVKIDADYISTCVGTFPAFHFLSDATTLNHPYNAMYYDRTMDYGKFLMQFSVKSEESSSCSVYNNKLQKLGQNCDVKTSPTTDDEELFCCAVCSATFHHKRTIAAHMKTHFE